MKKMKLFKKMLAGILAGAMCCSMSIGAFAAETLENGNIWYGGEKSKEVIAGENGYTFMSVYEAPYCAYELSCHTLVNGGAVGLYPMIDASKDYTWKPNGLYEPYGTDYDKVNYEALYCCDQETDYNSGIYYKRLNLENSEYYDDVQARKIRAIVTNSYPYVSLDTMREKLAESKFAYANEIDRAEAITAVQAAIWGCANGLDNAYNQTRKITKDLWGGAMHNFTAEMSEAIQNQGSGYKKYEEVGTRINALIDHLLSLEETYAEDAAIIISKLEMNGKTVQVNEDTVNLKLNLELNNSGSGYDDKIEITVSSSIETVNFDVELGKEQYTVDITAAINDEIKAVVSGTQVLPKDVYFYAPEPADVDGDGVATSREVSQNLVGVAVGPTSVYAEASMIVQERIINFEKTTTDNQYKKPLEGIVFDIYYAGTVDEYTQFVENYVKDNEAVKGVEAKKVAEMAQDAFEEEMAEKVKAGAIELVETVTTDITGKAVYNITRDGQDDGIYLIIEREHPAVKTPLAPFVVAVPMTAEDGSGLKYEVNLQPKNEVYTPVINKDVIEIDNDSASVDAAENFTWIVRTNIPKDIENAKSYVITDTIDYRLTYAGNLVVKVEEKTAEADNSDVTTDADDAVTDEAVDNVLVLEEDYTVIVKGDGAEAVAAAGVVEGEVPDAGVVDISTADLIVELTKDGMKKVAELAKNAQNDMEIRVYFDTFVDKDAMVGEKIPNQATLIYTNSANFEFEVESDEPIVYTCGISLEKYDAKNRDILLDGAEFMLARLATEEEVADPDIKTETLVLSKGKTANVIYVEFYDSEDWTQDKVQVVTTVNGKALLYGLEKDTYYLVETKAPEGYNLLSYPIPVTLDEVSHKNIVAVANSNNFVLPGTGGIGTTIFTLVGAAMTLGSGAVLAGKKRKEDEE